MLWDNQGYNQILDRGMEKWTKLSKSKKEQKKNAVQLAAVRISFRIMKQLREASKRNN